MLAFTFMLLVSPQAFIPALGYLRVAFLIGAFAVAAHCWTQFAARRPMVNSTLETRLALALLAWAIATIPLSLWPGGSLGILLGLYLKALIVFWLLSETVTTLGRLRTVTWGLSLMVLPLAVTALRNSLFHHTYNEGRILGYGTTMTANPNDLALMLNLVLPLTIALFFLNRRPMARGLLAILIVLDASAIVVTFSRGGFITLLATLFLYSRSTFRWRQGRWAVAALVLAVAAVPFLPSGYMDRLSTIFDNNADPTGSAQGRRRDMTAAMAFMLSHPLVGAGIGQDILALNELRGATWHSVHNVYLEYATDLGWPGLGLFLLLLMSCIRTAARVRERCAGLPALRELSDLAEAIRIALVAFAIMAFFSPVAYNFYFYYLAGLAVPLPAIYAAEARNRLRGAGAE
jgi:O-antigen ligase